MAGIQNAHAEQIASDHYNLVGSATKLESEWGSTFKISVKNGPTYLLKITPHHVDKSRTDLEIAVISHLMQSDIEIAFPRLIWSSDGQLSVHIKFGLTRMYEWVHGQLWHEVDPQTPELLASLGAHLAGLKSYLDKFDHPTAHFYSEWSPDQVAWVGDYIDLLMEEDRDMIRVVLSACAQLNDTIAKLPHSVNHNDANDHNIIVSKDINSPEITGFIDFGDLHYGPRINDLAICLAYTTMRKMDPVGAAAYIIGGFYKISPLLKSELNCLLTLIKSRLTITITKAAIRARKDPDNAYWQVSAADARQLLRQLSAYPEHIALCRFSYACGIEPSPKEMLQHRQKVLGPNLSVSRKHPLHIVCGWKSNLYAADGASFLDTRNNIAHVGHEHPRIVMAGQKQMAVLNTNTRYLHALRLELADRLLETLPDNLAHIYFVNSGSEANDLALRMARNHVDRKETLVMDQAYHGATASCLDVSPYKFAGPGGSGCQAHIHVLPHLRSIDATSTEHAVIFIDSVNPTKLPMTFIHEALPGCAGQIVPPADYFAAIYEVIKGSGGVCIVDEVQTGMGRVGEVFWSFGLFGIEPDIVTIGKPLGNGHPVAAVAVSKEIAESFDNGMEFFSSFGGNPVSCAIALEVLNVIRDEDLQSHALNIGKYWMDAIRKMAVDHPIIHQVRGYGLFFGIEFLLENDQSRISRVCDHTQNGLLDHHILTSFDGPQQNVMKIKPPMCITFEEVDYFMEILEKVLLEDFGAI